MPRLSLVVPTYNEADNLPHLLERVATALQDVDFELVIVDDSSPDGTADRAEEFRETYSFLRVVRRTGKRDLALSVIEGFHRSSGDILTVMDADLQHPPEKLVDLLAAIDDGADVVVGSRYVPGGEIEQWSLLRRLSSKGATLMAHLLLPGCRTVSDPLSGFFMLRSRVIDGVELRPVGYKILLEILIRGRCADVREVPIVFQDRERGSSSLVANEYGKYLRHLLRLSWDTGEIVRFIKFMLVGGSGVLVNLGVLWLLTERAGLFYLFSAMFAIELSILSNYALNEVWTFHDRGEKGLRSAGARLLKFNVISSPSFPMQLGVMGILREVFGYYYLFAAVIAIGVVFIWNFFANNFWTWFR
ncbi:MAG: glycosyltransferase family 2 protein [Thermoplasmatota archaeon]